MRMAVWFGWMAVLLWGSWALAHNDLQSAAQSVQKIDEHSNGQTVTAKKLDELELSLAENPTTGYSWNLKSSGEPVCKLENTVYESPSERIGQGGRRRWLFKIVESGQATLELAYQRPFERDKPPAKSFKVNIQADH